MMRTAAFSLMHFPSDAILQKVFQFILQISFSNLFHLFLFQDNLRGAGHPGGRGGGDRGRGGGRGGPRGRGDFGGLYFYLI